uniref:CSON008711 protein n=1 Tax=Culicoides sonorensis TaxID=179676 RepID=A0A336N1P4_CULSO
MSDDRQRLLDFYRSGQTSNDRIGRNESILENQNRESVDSDDSGTKTLSLFFASLCVIDLFGVFPIVALPRSIILCGLYGIPLVLFVITLQIYTAVILGRCWVIAERLKPEIVKQNRYPYAAIAELTFGKKMSYLVTILLDVTVFGGGIPNLLVASQNLELLGSRITHGSFQFSFCYWLIIIGCLLCPLMWLGSPKNMKVLASISVTVCTSVAVLTWLSIFDDTNIVDNSSDDLFIDGNVTNITAIELIGNASSNIFEEELVREYVPWAGLSMDPPPAINLLKAYGIIAFQFDIHPMLLTIQVDMKEKRRIGKAVCYGIMTTCFLSAITTILAAYRYGIFTTANVLVSLPRSWDLYLIILLVTLQLCLSSAVGSSALFQHIEDIVGASRDFSFKRCVIRSLLVALAVFLGELLPRFDIVMGLIGGTLTGPLIFILPPLFYTKILRMERKYEENLSRKGTQESIDDDALFKQVEQKVKRKHKGYGAISDVIPEIDFSDNLNENYFKHTCTIIFNVLKSDCLLSIAVILFGLVATFTSTYFNVFDGIDNFDQLWSPCILNITDAISNLSNL